MKIKKLDRAITSAHLEKKQQFIQAIAEYLCQDSASKSIELEMGRTRAKEWAKVRNASPIFGYATVEEAQKTLAEFFG